MKCYEVYPMDWNKEHTEVESDVYNAEYYDTYKDAVQHAKKLCKSHAYARIDLYQLNKSDCEDAADFEDEWSYNRGEHLQWTEKFQNGVQVPAVYIGDREIWRWNMKGGVEDLKPRNVKRK